MELRKQFVDQIRPNHEKISYINDETSKGCHFNRCVAVCILQEVMLHEGEQPAGPKAIMNTLEHKPGRLKCKHLKKTPEKVLSSTLVRGAYRMTSNSPSEPAS